MHFLDICDARAVLSDELYAMLESKFKAWREKTKAYREASERLVALVNALDVCRNTSEAELLTDLAWILCMSLGAGILFHLDSQLQRRGLHGNIPRSPFFCLSTGLKSAAFDDCRLGGLCAEALQSEGQVLCTRLGT